MLPKIAHYSGFQSYGDLPYPALKAGKKTNDANDVWEPMANRNRDELKVYDNVQRFQTVYQKQVERVVTPEDYRNPTKIPKGLMGFGNETTTSINNNDRKQKHELAVPEFVTTQTKFTQPFDSSSKGLEMLNSTIQNLKSGRPLEADYLNKTNEQSFRSSLRSQDPTKQELTKTGVEHWQSTYSAGNEYPYTTSKAARPTWTLHKAPYTVDKYPRASEYINQFGNKATNPIDRYDRELSMPPVPKNQDELRKGSTQTTFHIPGYTGHIPKNPKTDDEIIYGGIGAQTRSTWMKQNITENYHTRVPGYAGHRPRCALNDRGALREKCFSTIGEKY